QERPALELERHDVLPPKRRRTPQNLAGKEAFIAQFSAAAPAAAAAGGGVRRWCARGNATALPPLPQRRFAAWRSGRGLRPERPERVAQGESRLRAEHDVAAENVVGDVQPERPIAFELRFREPLIGRRLVRKFL